MSNFLRDLAIAKFPRFGIVYYVQCNGEPSIEGSNLKAPIKFYDGKTTPPTHIADKTIRMPIWKWGELLDVIEEECFAEHPTIVAVELIRRRPDDIYGNLQIQLTHQVQLDANRKDAPSPVAVEASRSDDELRCGNGAPHTEQEGPSKPAGSISSVAIAPQSLEKPSERGQPQAGSSAQYEAPVATPAGDTELGADAAPTHAQSEPPAACSHPPLERIVMHDGTDVYVWQCSVCLDVVTVLKDRAEVVE